MVKRILGFEGEFFKLWLFLDSKVETEDNIWVTLQDKDQQVTFIEEFPSDALTTMRIMIDELNKLHQVLQQKVSELVEK